MRYVDLFCGCGAVSSAFEQCGGECVGAVDNDDAAQRIYTTNFPSHAFVRHDLSQELPSHLAWSGADVVVGGPPCQDFSTARRTDARERRSLTVMYAWHAVRLGPRWIVYENVARAKASDEFGELCRVLQEAGFVVRHSVVDVTQLGVPQTRKRLILIACRDKDALDRAWENFRGRFCKPVTTMRECFVARDLPFAEHVFFPACNQKARKSVYTVDGPAPTIRSIVRPLRKRYSFLSCDSTQCRADVFPSLTIAHHAAIQGFPSTFQWPVSRTSCAKCIGNAVPIQLSEALYQSLKGAAA